jgi:hypothetical protein
LVSKIARITGAEDKSRTFSPWSHVVSLGYAQLTHCMGLNDVCDSLQLHSGPLAGIRGASAPSRNGLVGKRNVTCNARMGTRELKAHCALDEATLELLKQAMAELKLSARTYDRILTVARINRVLARIRRTHLGPPLRSHPVSFAGPAVVGVNTDLAKLEESDAGNAQRLVGEL